MVWFGYLQQQCQTDDTPNLQFGATPDIQLKHSLSSVILMSQKNITLFNTVFCETLLCVSVDHFNKNPEFHKLNPKLNL